MSAKARRHERRKTMSIARQQDRNLAIKIECAITGVTKTVNKALTLGGFREIKLFEIERKKLKSCSGIITARGKEKLVRGSIPLI